MMELTIRDWMVIVGVLLIVAVLLDAWRRVKSERYSRVKMKLAEPDEAGSDEDEDLAWLKERSPLPLMADESYERAESVDAVLRGFHAVNVKLVKAGGITGGHRALTTARAAGLKTMLGCMIESSLAITAAAMISPLVDYADLDGNLLIRDDPFVGATVEKGQLVLPTGPGLGVEPRH